MIENENMPVEQDASLQGKPLTLREKFFLCALMVVTGLWTLLLYKGAELVIEWIRGW